MKVLFCVYGYSPKVEPLQPWLTVHEVASVLIDAGWEVHLLTDVNEAPTLAGLRHHWVRTMRPTNVEEVRAVLEQVEPDRVLVLSTPLNLMVGGWYKHVRCKLIAFMGYPFYSHAELARALPHLRRDDMVTYGRHALIPKVVWSGTLRRYYSAVIAQSPRTARRVAASAGGSLAEYAIPAGLDLDFWKPCLEGTRRSQNVLRFLYVGSAKAIRGFNVLLDAFRKLDRADVELRILARGSTPDEVIDLQRMIDARVGPVRDRVEIIGGWMDRDRYREELRAADVVTLPFVLVPSELPVSVIECIACGTPVIGTDIDGLPDAIGTAGVVVRSGSIKALETAMRELVESPSTLEGLRLNCLEARNRMFDWGWVGREWLRVLSA